MTLEAKLKTLIGEQAFAISALQVRVEQLEKQLAAAQKPIAVSESETSKAS